MGRRRTTREFKVSAARLVNQQGSRIASTNAVMEWGTHAAIASTMKHCRKVHQSHEKVGQAGMFGPVTAVVLATR